MLPATDEERQHVEEYFKGQAPDLTATFIQKVYEEVKRPHKTWLGAKCPVYIDFGDEQLARLQTYDATGLLCVFRLSKSRFVHDVMRESDILQIAMARSGGR